MNPQKTLRARALDILSRQEISRAELKRKLAPHAESEEEIERVLNEFADRRWQSDERYAEAYIHSKSRKHGSLRLKQALAQKGVDEETVRAFLPDRDNELASAVEVVRNLSAPRKSSDQAAGLLPYISAKYSPCLLRRMLCSTSRANSAACAAVHCGKSPA